MTGTTMAVLLAVILPTAAAADDRGLHHEEGRNQAALQDDLRDEQQAEDLLRQFDGAAARRNWLSLAFIEGRVMEALRRENDEAAQEVARNAREAMRSDEEVRRDEEELTWDARRGDHREYRQDRHELRGDRADAEKDRHDFMEKVEYRRRIQGLKDEWARLRGQHRPGAIQRKHDILVELVRLSRLEIRSDAGELHEDHGERRDDREGHR